MPLNRFWSSVWSAVAFLFAVSLLQYIAVRVATLFGLLPAVVSGYVVQVVSVVVPVAGALTYADWRWGWRSDNLGLQRSAGAVAWALVGLAGGGVAAYLSSAASALLAGQGANALKLPSLVAFDPYGLVLLLLGSFVVELIFRGAVVSRFRSDLSTREALLAGVLTPFIWTVVQMLFGGYAATGAGIGSVWQAAMMVALVLLFVRTDSVWLAAGLRGGMLAALRVFDLGVTNNGALVVWGVLAVLLLAWFWSDDQRQPRRSQPVRNQQRAFRSRTVRGPWGPH